jgi:GNAT superfamily N-acetyltransferase
MARVEADGAVVAGIGMTVIEWPPHLSHPAQEQRGYTKNAFVEPTHRRSCLASRLIEMANDEARRRGITFMVLHGTKLGRPAYERRGWRPTTEMAISVT